jgi:hypothetical protein
MLDAVGVPYLTPGYNVGRRWRPFSYPKGVKHHSPASIAGIKMDQHQLISPLKGGHIKTEFPIEFNMLTYFSRE